MIRDIILIVCTIETDDMTKVCVEKSTLPRFVLLNVKGFIKLAGEYIFVISHHRVFHFHDSYE